MLQASPALADPPPRVPLSEALRRDIARLLRALPDDELLALVGDRVADLVARRAALAPPAREETGGDNLRLSARSSPAKPRARRAGAPRPEPEPHAEEEDVCRGRHAPMLPWPRAAEDGTPIGIDLTAPGLTPRTKTIADDVRRLVLARWKGNAARLLDPEDLVQEVYRRILRRNRRPCAFDPRQGSVGHYIHRIAGCAIADMLKPAKRRADHELLSVNPDEHPEPAAPEPDPDAAPLDPDAAPTDPDEREAFFAMLCCLEMFGELPITEPLWRRALKQREAEQERERAEREREQKRAAKEEERATKATRKQKRGALDAEILAFLQSETAQGKPVLRGELAGMLGTSVHLVSSSLERLIAAGAVEVRRPGGARPATYWARTEAAPLLPIEGDLAPELPPEVCAELPPPEAATSIPPGLVLAIPFAAHDDGRAMATVASLSRFATADMPRQLNAVVRLPPELADEPAPSAAPAPVAWPRRRLNAKRLHVSFPAMDLAMFAPAAPESRERARRGGPKPSTAAEERR